MERVSALTAARAAYYPTTLKATRSTAASTATTSTICSTWSVIVNSPIASSRGTSSTSSTCESHTIHHQPVSRHKPHVVWVRRDPSCGAPDLSTVHDATEEVDGRDKQTSADKRPTPNAGRVKLNLCHIAVTEGGTHIAYMGVRR